MEQVTPTKDNGGTWVELGGRQYKVPPLNFRALRELAAKIEEIQKTGAAPNLAQVNAMIEVIHRAVQRNYPDMSLDDLLDMIDLGNARPILLAIMSVSGAKASSPGEPQAQ